MILRAPCIIDFIGGEWITWASVGEGALDAPGPLNGTSEASAKLSLAGNDLIIPGQAEFG